MRPGGGAVPCRAVAGPRVAQVPPDRGGATDAWIGVEARGFIAAAPVAYRFGAGFVPVRKAGKLPWQVEKEEYVLEYGTGYFAELPEAQLSRIDYTRGNRTPEPKAAADVTNGTSPLTVTKQGGTPPRA